MKLKYMNETETAPNRNDNYFKWPQFKQLIQLGSGPLNDSNCLNNVYIMVDSG